PVTGDPALNKSILDAVQDAFEGENDEGATPPTAAAGESLDPPEAPDEDPADPVVALSGASRAERRRALARLTAGDLASSSIEVLTRVLAEDPDPDIRLMAAEALTPVAPRLSFPLIQRALQDPSDRVRAAVVGLAAAAGPTGIATLIPLLAGRRWPLAQE